MIQSNISLLPFSCFLSGLRFTTYLSYNKKLNSNGYNLYLHIWMNVFQYNRRKIKPQMSRKVNDISCLYYFDLDTNKVKCDLKGLQFINVMTLTSKRYALFVETQLFEKNLLKSISAVLWKIIFLTTNIGLPLVRPNTLNQILTWNGNTRSFHYIKGPGLVYFWSKINNNFWNYHLNLLWWLAKEYLT